MARGKGFAVQIVPTLRVGMQPSTLQHPPSSTRAPGLAATQSVAASAPTLERGSYQKVRFRGLAKNTAQLVTLFALSNLWMARRHLLAGAGEVRL